MARQGRREAPSFSSERLQRAASLLQSWIDDGLTPGLAAVIARDGRLVAELYGGSADGERPVEAGTLFCLGALSAPFAAATALHLVQDGLIGLDEPLDELVPELADEVRSHLSLRRLLTHATGLAADFGPEARERLGPTPTPAAIADEHTRLELLAPPGSQVRFSQLGGGLLARVLERLLGQPYPEALRRGVLEPLGLTQTMLTPAPEDLEHLARVAEVEPVGAPEEPYNSPWWRALGLPNAGLFSTAREVARFLTACLAEAPIAEFLAPVTLDLMTQNGSAELSGGIVGLSAWHRAEWGLGFELRGDKQRHPFGDLVSPETFGHLGETGTLAWADPDTGLVCVLLTNRQFPADQQRRLAGFARFSNAVAGALLD